MKQLLIITALISTSVFAADLPDSKVTPGVTNPAVTQETINQTICVSGWTKTIRPPVSYTNKLKKQQMAAANLPGDPSLYEEDHLISIELGGSPTDPKNLWPEKWDGEWGAHKKDVIETRLKRMVCTGKITLAEAQHAIATDWIAAYKQYVPAKK